MPGAVSGEIQATRVALVGEIATTRKELLAAVTGQAEDAQAKVDRALKMLDNRTDDVLARVDTLLATTSTVRGRRQRSTLDRERHAGGGA